MRVGLKYDGQLPDAYGKSNFLSKHYLVEEKPQFSLIFENHSFWFGFLILEKENRIPEIRTR
jgi:hypothetical protein